VMNGGDAKGLIRRRSTSVGRGRPAASKSAAAENQSNLLLSPRACRLLQNCGRLGIYSTRQSGIGSAMAAAVAATAAGVEASSVAAAAMESAAVAATVKAAATPVAAAP